MSAPVSPVIEVSMSTTTRNDDHHTDGESLAVEDSVEQRRDRSADPFSNKCIEDASTTRGGVPPDGDLLNKSSEDYDTTSATTEGDDGTANEEQEGDEANMEDIEEDFKSSDSSPPTDANGREDKEAEEKENEEENVGSGSSSAAAGNEDDDDATRAATNVGGNEDEKLEEEEEATVETPPNPDLVNFVSSILASRVASSLSALTPGPPPPAEEQASNKSETLVDKAIQFLDDCGIVNTRKRHDVSEERTVFSFATQLANCNLDNRLDVRELKRLVAFYCISPLRIPEKKRQAAMEFFTRANYDLLNGCFELDLRDGEFRYKVCSNFVGAEITHETIRYMYLVAANTMSRYYEGIMQLVYCGKIPVEAVRDCEVPPSEPPSSPQQ
jgi:hypothetical protein